MARKKTTLELTEDQASLVADAIDNYMDYLDQVENSTSQAEYRTLEKIYKRIIKAQEEE